MGVSSSQRLGVVALPYKAAEAEGGRGRVGGEKSQHPAAGAGRGARSAAPEAGEPLGWPAAPFGPLPASYGRLPAQADSKENDRTAAQSGWRSRGPGYPMCPPPRPLIPCKPRQSLGGRGAGHTPARRPNQSAQLRTTAHPASGA
ncbi:unnamed protein product [Pipistrellus nathusii]|uniref:Uncharacterized protein n=1 Tax=Pipistrellus nathusii TaxID=59473 RepID=A0ABP0A8A8_PIPNA